jgi:hypothetical protein
LEQRLGRRLPVEVRDRAGDEHADGREHEARDHGGPERRVAIEQAERLALDERRAQGEVGEDEDEAREHQRERGEAVLVRREQPCDDDRRHGPHELAADLRGPDPDQAAEHTSAQIGHAGSEGRRHRHRG